MAFPQTPLDVEVSLALSADLTDPGSWSWTDITSYVRENNRIRIRRGRSSERSTIPPSRCTLTVDNTDGRFCRFLPTGAWYGQIGPNTPIRVRVDNGSGYVTRFVGYVSGWPPSWDPSEQDQTVQLVADGILRRLGQGRVLRSAMYRTMAGVAPGDYVPHAYWPMEDGPDATVFASAIPGRPALAAGGGIEPGADDTLVSSEALATLTASDSVTFTIPDYTNAGQCVVQWMMQIPTEPGAEVTLAEFTGTGGPVNKWRITLVPGSPTNLWIYDLNSSGVVVNSTGIPLDGSSTHNPSEADFFGHWAMMTFAIEQIGGFVDHWLGVTVDPTDGGVSAANAVAGTTGKLTSGTFFGAATPSLGHVVVYTDGNFDAGSGGDAANNAAALAGYAGEMAHERVERLCREESIPVTVTATTSQAMGPQGTTTLVSLLRECATTDFGLLYEPLDAGLAYLSSTERYNQAAAITLQYDQGQISPPWEPTDDDRDTRNDVTASRSGGSSARVTDETSIAAIGVYDDTLSVNTETDDQLNDVAGWAVNLGTVDELRWPAVRPNLRAHPSLIDDWMAADIGSQLHVTGHPSPLAPDEIMQIVEGYDETVGSYEYTVVANLSPASGWIVGELDDDDLGKLDTDGTELCSAVNSSATSLTVATLDMDSPLWTTDAGEMPVPVILGGEVVSATSIASSVRDTFAGSSSNGWGTSDSGHAWTIGAGTASLFSETGGVGRIAISALNTVHHISVDTGYAARQRVRVYNTLAVTPTGAAINWGLLLRYVDASNYYWLDVQVGTSGSLTLRAISVISSVVTQLATATSRTTHSTSVERILVAEIGDDDLIRAKVYANGATEPDWELSHQASTTDLQTGTRVGCIGRLMTGNTNTTPVTFNFDNFAVLNPQVMTVTRSVNGVAKSQTAGTAVNVYRPARLAL